MNRQHSGMLIAGCAFVTMALVGGTARSESTDLFADPAAWRLDPATSWRWDRSTGQPEQPVLTLHEVGPPKTEPVRRPFTTAVYEGASWPSATIDLEVMSLETNDTVGRDVCVLLGYRDDTHYTYVHLSNDADGRVHNLIMKVDGDTRRMIQTPLRPEPRLHDGWQRVRVTYDDAGRIAVYMGDDLDNPLMTATDPDVAAGRVGLGTFNDRAAFRAVTVRGQPTVQER